MSDMSDMPESLRQAWELRHPGVPMFALDPYREHHVRFHTLPDSRRTPRDDDDDREIVRREKAILGSLAGDASILVVVMSWGDEATSALSSRRRRLLPDAVLATRWSDEDGDTDLFVSPRALADPLFEKILLAGADEEYEDIRLVAADLTWMAGLYDGGIDVYPPSAEQREALAHGFADWQHDPDHGDHGSRGLIEQIVLESPPTFIEQWERHWPTLPEYFDGEGPAPEPSLELKILDADEPFDEADDARLAAGLRSILSALGSTESRVLLLAVRGEAHHPEGVEPHLRRVLPPLRPVIMWQSFDVEAFWQSAWVTEVAAWSDEQLLDLAGSRWGILVAPDASWFVELAGTTAVIRASIETIDRVEPLFRECSWTSAQRET